MSNQIASGRAELLGLAPSFGFGDRLGLATPGHVLAMQQAGSGLEPIFPQQSIREMQRTRREPEQVLAEAFAGMAQAGWTGRTGADADHLKTTADIDRTAAAGFTFFTLDPSDFVDGQADFYDELTLRERFVPVREAVGWWETYLGRVVGLTTGTQLVLDEAACMRCAVKYGRAIQHTIHLAAHLRMVQTAAGRPYEIELSVDETSQPTTLAEHFIIADQCLKHEMKLVSLAPRLPGEFEKGVDFKGERAVLAQALRDHAAIAAMLGPYKLSLHSGSDKLSMYGDLARATAGRFHVKTAGTSYLEALRVLVRHEPEMFRQLLEFARSRYETDRASYHVSATLASVPAPTDLSLPECESLYLEQWASVPAGQGFTAPGRQIVHCTFGSVLTDPHWGPTLRQVLQTYPDTYQELLADHFRRHLQALQTGL